MTRVKTCIVAAHIPGFYGLYIVEDDASDSLCWTQAPVVAWRIAEEVNDNDRTETTAPYATPITCEVGCAAAVLAPTGEVHDSESSWDSIESWLAHEQESRTRARAARAAKLATKSAQPAVPHNPFAPVENNTNKTLTLQARRGGDV